MVEPAYLRIVEDITRRIDSGELRPGDRVPSARRITREWGVAIATATKVLTRLQQDGAVHVLPGVGTVVSGDPAAPTRGSRRSGAGATARRGVAAGVHIGQVGRPGDARPTTGPRPEAGPRELSRERIVRAAIELADTEGLTALSMRRVAAHLDVATMSLYRYVRGRDDLILFMIDEAIGPDSFPAVPAPTWRSGLEIAARMQWRAFTDHPWLAPIMSVTRPQLAPNALKHAEWVLGALSGLGLRASEMLRIHVMLFSYVRGIATNLEAEAEAQRETGMDNDEWMAAQRAALSQVAGPGRLANLVTAMAEEPDFDFNLDDLFEFGLTRLLDGLDRHLAQVRKRRL